MSNDITLKAEKVVIQFKQELTSNTLNNLNDADLERLATLIATALSEERMTNAKRVEAFAEQLKEGIHQVDLAL